MLIKKYGFLADNELKWIASSLLLGAIAADIYICITMDFLGRIPSTVLICLPCFFGWAILATAHTYAKFCLGRFILGFGMAITCIFVPLYIAEIADKYIRGALSTIFIMAIAVGMIIVYCLEKFGTMDWITVPFCAIPVLLLAIINYIPKSPILLCRKRQKEKARQNLQLFRGENYDISEEFAEVEMYSQVFFLSLHDSLSKKGSVTGMTMLIIMHCIQQLSGINTIIFYSYRICDMKHLFQYPIDGAIIFATVQLISNLVSSLTVDKLGRKPLWILSLAAMSISYIVIGVCFMEKWESKYLTASIIILIAAYSLGAGPLPFVMGGELLSLQVKTFVTCIAMICNWLIGFFVVQLFQAIIDKDWAHYMFFMYATFCFIGALTITRILIETKHKSLLQIVNELDV
ncbi:hypothetical protein RI129_002220 [Pyrocoelia pectoralis]|uniref:Major facilitator superfamily (MFS) profile domain-containing protein n=1 Tax=Pyrocoelia pectoralis TaxID=417401 RepID=A0AAN7VM72_9COLE